MITSAPKSARTAAVVGTRTFDDASMARRPYKIGCSIYLSYASALNWYCTIIAYFISYRMLSIKWSTFYMKALTR